MLNPTPLLLPPLFLTLSLPLFLFAALTSTVAITALLARVALVYIELGVVITHDYFSSSSSSPSSPPRPSSTTPPPRRRRLSSTPTPQVRDYEGVGGWRIPGAEATEMDEDEDEKTWTGMNSRLELPARTAGRHRRSLTGGGGGEGFGARVRQGMGMGGRGGAVSAGLVGAQSQGSGFFGVGGKVSQREEHEERSVGVEGSGWDGTG